MNAGYALEMVDITKRFPGTIACDHVSLRVGKGEVHALLGENGAGKSTLMKILSGSYLADSGTISVGGRVRQFHSPNDSSSAGIAVIYQELDLLPDLTVAQNMFIGTTQLRSFVVNNKDRYVRAEEALSVVGAVCSPRQRVGRLPIAQQQLVAIAKAVAVNASIVVMDEPTATLSDEEVDGVLDVVRTLRRQGKSVIYISHRLDEIGRVADRVTVLRDGKNVAEYSVNESDAARWTADMIGHNKSTPMARSVRGIGTAKRGLSSYAPSNDRVAKNELLNIDHVRISHMINMSGVTVARGEIVGLAGLDGSGRTTLLSALFGAIPSDNEVVLEGERIIMRSPRQARRLGIGLVPEDRKTQGLMLGLPVIANAAITTIDGLPWFLPRSRSYPRAKTVLDKLGTKISSSLQRAGQLSGGNQQKVVLAKWLSRGVRLLLLDEPTRGLDVGAKFELFRRVREVAESGMGVLVASSELPELMANTDRIYVVHEGRIIGNYQTAITTADVIGNALINGARGKDDNTESNGRP